MDGDGHRPSGVVPSSGRAGCAFFAFAVLFASSGCSSTFTQRPYRFDLATPPATTTQIVAERMSRDTETAPVLVDPARGVVLSKWTMVGVSASLRLWPPGQARAWIVERWRATVLSYGWSSTVLIDVERAVCDTEGFRWDALNLWGRCSEDTSTNENGQARIDGKGASLARNAVGRP
jgi:hypothetical protein